MRTRRAGTSFGAVSAARSTLAWCSGCALATLVTLPAPIARAETHAPPRADYNLPDPQAGAASYARAVANMLFMDYATWQVAWLEDKDWAPITRDTLRANLRAGFAFDHDILQTNFFGHPYHGGLQFNAARGAALGFWESSIYTFAGSAAWELFAEREKPALNDLFVTTLGGMMLGEITHRLSSELLDESQSGSPRLVSELFAAAVDPMRGFNRATTRRAWRDGPAPARQHPVRFALELGVDRVSFSQDQGDHEHPRPALLFAANVLYGNLRPAPGRDDFRPFDFFELYAAANLLNSQVSGAHVYSSGLLSGASMPLAKLGDVVRDNDVLGFAINYEYVGTNFTTYSGLGAGPVNHLALRLGGNKQLILSAGLDMVPILGVTSSEVGNSGRDYNITAGMSPWSGVRLKTGRFGELGLRVRHYVAKVLNGQPGEEAIGSMRLWLEVPIVEGFGAGLAPTLVYRRGHYDAQPSYSAQQLSAQFFVFSNL